MTTGSLKAYKRFGGLTVLGISNKKLNQGCMKSHPIKKLAGSEWYQAGDWSEVCIEWSFPTPVLLDNMVSILVNIHAEIEDWRWWV